MNWTKRWEAAAHAVQTGVAMEMQSDPGPTSPKHLRVGVDMALVDQGSMARLLISKGLITEEEYLRAIAEGMEGEKATYEKRLTAKFGKPITLA